MQDRWISHFHKKMFNHSRDTETAEPPFERCVKKSEKQRLTFVFRNTCLTRWKGSSVCTGRNNILYTWLSYEKKPGGINPCIFIMLKVRSHTARALYELYERHFVTMCPVILPLWTFNKGRIFAPVDIGDHVSANFTVAAQLLRATDRFKATREFDGCTELRPETLEAVGKFSAFICMTLERRGGIDL